MTAMTSPQPEFSVGMSISHFAFGVGSVEAVDGNELLVNFAKVGRRPIMKAFAKVVVAPVAANDNHPEPAAPRMHPDPYSVEAAGGLLGQIATWITSTSIIPVPELSLCSALALMAGLYGGKALSPSNSGINLYMTTVLDTAGGKGHPPKAIRKLAGRLGAAGKDAVVNGDHTSYAAIERTLRRSPSCAIVMDEFGLTLQDINATNRNSVAASIRKVLLAVYDQANSVFDGRIYASAETKKELEPIDGPALTVLGMTTNDTLYAGLSEASVADGFLNRFLFVTADTSGRQIKVPSLNRETNVPPSLEAALKEALLSFPTQPKGGNLAKPEKLMIEMDGGESGEAYARWGEVFLWQQSPHWREDARNIIGRASENTLRLATLRAISRIPAAPLVSVEDVEWGWAIVHRSVNLVREGVRLHMSASPAEALRKAIVAAITEFSGPMPYSKLMERKGVRGSDTRQLADALRWLVESGQVVDANSMPSPGKGSKFRLAA